MYRLVGPALPHPFQPGCNVVVMPLHYRILHSGFAALATLFLFGSGQVQATSANGHLVVSDPESLGFSAERLKRLDTVMAQAVDEKEYPGVVTLLARHGKIVHYSSIGRQDLETGASMPRDAIFRIASMSKPVTAAAMMILYEEGKWTLQDPVAKFIPEFGNLQVYTGRTDLMGKLQLEEPVHAPTLLELMTHTAGFSYGNEQTPADRLYRDGGDKNILASPSLQAMVTQLSGAPLLFQPSTHWKYSVAADLQGYMIEKLSGMKFSEFLKKRLFEPLGMHDTGFYVPEDKRARFAAAYQMSDSSHHFEAPMPAATPFGNFEKPPGFESGGAGLVSTAMDYYRFCQMLLNGGQLDGVRILSPASVKLMLENHLTDGLMGDYKGSGFVTQPRPGLGYGFGGAVVTDAGLANVPMGKGSYLWDGGFGTWFWVDPTNDIVFIGMVQRACWVARPCSAIQQSMIGMPPNLEELSRAMTYQALLAPEK